MLRKIICLFYALAVLSAVTPLVHASELITADISGDGDVDGSDLAILAAHFGQTNCEEDCESDLDGDGNVDDSDLVLFAEEFGFVYVWPPPTVDLNVDSVAILFGETATLFWNSTDADSCVIEPGIGSVEANGSTLVSPTETTIYTITAIGQGGTAVAGVTITVIFPAPLASLTAQIDMIQAGGTATLTWNTSYADTCMIGPDIGTVGLNGSILVSPMETTTYTLTATSPCCSVTKSVTVIVSNYSTFPSYWYPYWWFK